MGHPPLRPGRPDVGGAAAGRLDPRGRRRATTPRPGTPSTPSTPRSTPPAASCSATWPSTCRPTTACPTWTTASCSRCSPCRRAWRCPTPASASGSPTGCASTGCSPRSPGPAPQHGLAQALATAVAAVAECLGTVQTWVRTFPTDAQGSQLGIATPRPFTPAVRRARDPQRPQRARRPPGAHRARRRRPRLVRAPAAQRARSCSG